VPADDGAETGGGGVQVQLVEIVEHVKIMRSDLDGSRLREAFGPLPLVGIASHGGQRRNLLKRSQDIRLSDVSRVDNVRAAL
jgi:hypothetical protein